MFTGLAVIIVTDKVETRQCTSSICYFRGDSISWISLIFRVFSFKFTRFWANVWLFMKIFSFKIFALFPSFPATFQY